MCRGAWPCWPPSSGCRSARAGDFTLADIIRATLAVVLVLVTIRYPKATYTIAAENRSMAVATTQPLEQARGEHQEEVLPIIVVALVSRDGNPRPTTGDLEVEFFNAGRGPTLHLSFNLDTPARYRNAAADPLTLSPLAVGAARSTRFHVDLQVWSEDRETDAEYGAVGPDQLSASYQDVLNHRYGSTPGLTPLSLTRLLRTPTSSHRDVIRAATRRGEIRTR